MSFAAGYCSLVLVVVKVGRPVSILALAAALLLVIAPFQNCTNNMKLRGQTHSGPTLEAGGNGQPYEGKPYIFRDGTICPDRSEVPAVVKVRGLGDAALVRDNCQSLKSPVLLKPEDYSIAGGVLSYGGREFNAVVNDLAPVADSLVTNASFEEGLTGWYAYGDSFLTPLFQNSGIGGVKAGPSPSSGVEQDISSKVSAGRAYTLSVAAHTDNPADVAAVGCKYWDAANNEIGVNQVEVTDPDTYIVTCTVPAGTVRAAVFGWFGSGTTHIYLDDFELK